jgi:leucyl aminopeptidase
MPLPLLTLTTQDLSDLDVDIVVIGLTQTEDGLAVVAQSTLGSLGDDIQAIVASIEADGARDSVWRIPAPVTMKATSIIVTGLGSAEQTPNTLREAAGAALRSIKGAQSVAVSLPGHSAEIVAIAEGALIGAYRTTRHGQDDTTPVTAITVHGELTSDQEAQVVSASKAVWLVRDLVNLPPNMLTPETFVSHIIATIGEAPIDSEVLDEKQLLAQGFGGITAVGQGSKNPPRLLVLRYKPAEATHHVALVGKGITFDSGGLSLKPANSMVGMKYDMTGAAVVAAATLSAAEIGGATAITAWICLAENMPSGSASRPNDVITIKGGKTVEILNTDAEGRLVMADGLAAASAENPDLIVDVATLTGAARVALGERYAGLMGSEGAVSQVVAAATKAGELVWPMPLPAELRTLLNTEVADIANAKPGNPLGGMLLAGLFLQEFVGKTAEEKPIPWAHLDIAGPAANSSGAWGYTPKGPTGALTRTILELVLGASSTSK